MVYAVDPEFAIAGEVTDGLPRQLHDVFIYLVDDMRIFRMSRIGDSFKCLVEEGKGLTDGFLTHSNGNARIKEGMARYEPGICQCNLWRLKLLVVDSSACLDL